MDVSLITITCDNNIADIPCEVFDQLFQLAKRQYTVENIKKWYSAIVCQLSGADNHIAPSSVGTPGSNAETVVANFGDDSGNSGSTSAIEPLPGSHAGFGPSPGGNADLWPESLALSPYVQAQLPITTALSAPPIFVPTTNINGARDSLWSSNGTRLYPHNQENDLYAVTPSPTGYPLETAITPQWPSPQLCNNATYNSDTTYNQTDITNTNNPRKRRASHSPGYQMTLSSTAMPLLVPTTTASASSPSSSPLMPPSSTFGSVYPSTEVTHFREITVIPARKRRKGAAKGVHKILQPYHVSSDSI